MKKQDKETVERYKTFYSLMLEHIFKDIKTELSNKPKLIVLEGKRHESGANSFSKSSTHKVPNDRLRELANKKI
jgi:hypothetical protein